MPENIFQVCSHVNSMNVQRETDGLFSAMGYFRKDKALIITHNQTDTFKKDDKTIELVPAWKWMSE